MNNTLVIFPTDKRKIPYAELKHMDCFEYAGCYFMKLIVEGILYSMSLRHIYEIGSIKDQLSEFSYVTPITCKLILGE